MPLEETPYFFVDTIEQLREMNADLCKQSEIAVDLEVSIYVLCQRTHSMPL